MDPEEGAQVDPERAPAGVQETTPESELVADREPHGDALRMLVIGAIAAAVGIALALVIDWFPIQASREGEGIDTLWDVLLIASVPVFVLVEVVVIYSVIRFRMRPGEELKDGPPIHGNTTLEVVWTALPAILLVGLCTYAYIVLTDVEKARANTMNVRVEGQQFTWTFFYRTPDRKEVASPQLYLPVDQPVKFTVQSRDVIHDFFVPAFRLKIDAVPGISTSIRVRPKRIGAYPVVCLELCGLGHSTMRQTAHVVNRATFAAWLGRLGKPAPAGPGAAAPNGKAIFTDTAGCGACHALADAGTTGTTGPDLDEVLKGKDVAFIRQSIVNPNAQITRGYQPGIMPQNFGQTLQPDQLDALVDYLSKVAAK